LDDGRKGCADRLTDDVLHLGPGHVTAGY
jgi:hypothetical protein